MNKNKFDLIIDENDVAQFKVADKFTVAELIGVLCFIITELSTAIKLPAEQILNDMKDVILFSEGSENNAEMQNAECRNNGGISNDKEEKGPMREGEQVSDSAGI